MHLHLAVNMSNKVKQMKYKDTWLEGDVFVTKLRLHQENLVGIFFGNLKKLLIQFTCGLNKPSNF